MSQSPSPSPSPSASPSPSPSPSQSQLPSSSSSQPLPTRWLDGTHPASSITPHPSFIHLSHHVGTFLITFNDMNKRRGGAKPFRCAFAIHHKNTGPSTPSQLKSHIHGKVYAHKAFSNTYPNYQRGRYGCVMLNQHCAYVICGYVNGIEKDMVMMNANEADGTEKQHPSYALSVGATYLISFFCSSIYATVITHMSYLQQQIDSQSLQVEVSGHEEMNVNKRFLYKSKNGSSSAPTSPATSPSTSPRAKTERLSPSPRPPSTPTETSRSIKHQQPSSSSSSSSTFDMSMPSMGQRAQSLPVTQTQTPQYGLNIPTLKRKTTEETTPTHEIASQKRFRNSMTSAPDSMGVGPPPLMSRHTTDPLPPPLMSRHITDPLHSQSTSPSPSPSPSASPSPSPSHSHSALWTRNRVISNSSQSSDSSVDSQNHILGYDMATLDALRNAVSGLDTITTSGYTNHTSQSQVHTSLPPLPPHPHPHPHHHLSSKPQPPPQLDIQPLPLLEPMPQLQPQSQPHSSFQSQSQSRIPPSAALLSLPSLDYSFPTPSPATSSSSTTSSHPSSHPLSLPIPIPQRHASADTFPDATSYHEYKSLVHNYGNFQLDASQHPHHHHEISPSITSYSHPHPPPLIRPPSLPNSHDFILPTLPTPFATALTASYMPPMTPMTPLPATGAEH